MKKISSKILIVFLLTLTLLGTMSCGFTYYRDDLADEWQLEYQFQTLNRNVYKYGGSIEDLPAELKNVVYNKMKENYDKYKYATFEMSFDEYLESHYSAPSEYRFEIDQEIYIVYFSLDADNCYIYREDDKRLIGIVNRDISALLLKDDCLLYRLKNNFQKLNVLTGKTEKISKDVLETEISKLVPKSANLKEGSITGDYLKISKNIAANPAPEGSPNAWRTFFLHYDAYYFVSSGLLCKYDAEADTYVRIACMGERPCATFIYDDYMYYIHGTEGFSLRTACMQHNPPTLKKVTYARISLISFKIETVSESAFINLYNSIYD